MSATKQLQLSLYHVVIDMFTILPTCLGKAGRRIHLTFTEDKGQSGCISLDTRGFNDRLH